MNKQEERRWAPIEPSISLAEALARLSREELHEIRQTLNVKGASSLNKKDLADKLAEEIPSRLGELLALFDEERYRLLKTAADRGDGLPAPENAELAGYFLGCGLLYSGTVDGKRMLVLPQELKARIRDLDQVALKRTVRGNTKLARLVQGMLAYYGVLSIEDLPERLAPYVKGLDVPSDLVRFLDERGAFAGGFQRFEGGYADEAVVDAELILEEHAKRPNVPYYPFTEEQLLQAGAEDFIERTASFRSFVRFIESNYEADRELAEDAVMEAVLELQNGAMPSSLMELLQDRFEMADEAIVDGFFGHVAALHNNTRLWVLKGHSPGELSDSRGPGNGAEGAGDAAGARKVGRNDPCPCGSGKKYKKCCGANG